MVEYLSGGRVQGSSTLTEQPPQSQWKEIGRFEVTGSTAQTFSVRGLNSATSGSLANKKFLKVIGSIIPSGAQDVQMKFNDPSFSDTDQEYATRDNRDFNSSDSLSGSYDSITKMNLTAGQSPTVHWGFEIDIVNISGKEKLMQGEFCYSAASAIGTAPKSMQFTGKWSDTSSVIESINFTAGTNNFAVGTEVIVLGMDEDEGTTGTNFFQELAYIEPLSANATLLDSGEFTAKKYIIVEYFTKNSSAWYGQFNSDNAQNYAYRYYANSSAGGNSSSGQYKGFLNYTNNSDGAFGRVFVIGGTGQNKLIIQQANESSATNSGLTPYNVKVVGKWSGSDKIKSVQIRKEPSGGVSDIQAGSYIRVWGSD